MHAMPDGISICAGIVAVVWLELVASIDASD